MKSIYRKAALLGVLALVSGCVSLADRRGYVADETLLQSVQPGVDNRTSVEGTLGRPTFTSQFGQPTWYYVSSVTKQSPFGRPQIDQHSVLAVSFDPAGNVVSAERSGIEQVARISPDGDETPTLGRERSFLQDLFGNIGQVGAAGLGGNQGGGQGSPP
jgi:outer membrane protein assembly factor BamE (lipoprotein component of BamABCDE complex)